MSEFRKQWWLALSLLLAVSLSPSPFCNAAADESGKSQEPAAKSDAGPAEAKPKAKEEDRDNRISVGKNAPSFTAESTDGASVKLADYKDKVVVLDFFATWCGPCKQELPHLESEIWQKYKDRGLVVICLGREHSVDELKKFKEDNKLSMPVVSDPKRKIYAKYAKKIIPRNYVIDKSGKVVFCSSGYEAAEFAEMKKTIQSLLGVSPEA